MTRVRGLLALLAGSLGWMAVSACHQQNIETPIRVFDRPSDVALTCTQYDPNRGSFITRPIGDCDPNLSKGLGLSPDAAHPLPPKFTVGFGLGGPPFVPFTMAVVTQSARGELALVDTAQGKLVDLDPLTPSFGFVPVGKMPEHVRTSHDGCVAITTNTNSCDLSVVDMPSLINGARGGATGAISTDVRQLMPVVDVGGGKLRALPARPAWVEPALGADAALGQCGATAHRAWVALPNCALVVRMRVDGQPFDPQGRPQESNVDAAVRVTPSGAEVITDPNQLAMLSCPAECAGVQPLAAAPGGPTQSFPDTLAVDRDAGGGRLIIGDRQGERIDIIPLDEQGQLGVARSVQLEAGAGGVSVVRVSPRTPAGKFLYAIARDNTVRVIDLDREVECETNPDPRFVSPALNLQQTPLSMPPLPDDPLPEARRLGCFPLGDPGTPPRAPLATSPGISLVPGQLPRDVAFIHLDQPPPPTSSNIAPPGASPGFLVGDFAWIFSSDGRGTVIDLFDACPQPNQQDVRHPTGPYTPSCDLANVAISEQQAGVRFGHPQPRLLDRLSHRIRNGTQRYIINNAESDPTGMPRIASSVQPCVTLVPVGAVDDLGTPAAGRCDTATLPGLQPEAIPAPLIDASIPGAIDTFPTRVITFVNPDRARNETWSIDWEGTLPGTGRSRGQPRRITTDANTPQAATRAFLVDAAGAWCGRGVLAGDKLVLRGCTVDQECDQASGFKCVRDPGAPSSVTQGLCLHIGGKQDTVENWSQRCGQLLRAQRRYRITAAKQQAALPGDGTVTDYLQLAEIYEPEFSQETRTCTPPTDAGQPDPCVGISVPSVTPDAPPLATKCLPDTDGKSRCLLPCTAKDAAGDLAVCGEGFECAYSQMGDYRCLRAPVANDPKVTRLDLWQTCLPELQSYEIHVGDAYLVSGSASGVAANEQRAADGECMAPDVAALPPNQREAARLLQSRVPLSGAPGCPAGLTALGSLDPLTATRNVCQFEDSKFGARVVHYENPIFNISVLTPVSPADGRVLVPPDGTTIAMALVGGSAPLSVPLGVFVPAQLLSYATVAPDQQTIYLVDEGKSVSPTGLRGQLIRLFSANQSPDPLFVIR